MDNQLALTVVKHASKAAFSRGRTEGVLVGVGAALLIGLIASQLETKPKQPKREVIQWQPQAQRYPYAGMYGRTLQ